MTSTRQQGKQFAYDVFLSHNQADKPKVRRLAERLRAAGLRQSNFGFRISNFGFPPEAALSPAALGSDWVGWSAAWCAPKLFLIGPVRP